jgi:amino acid adenylation domain-containing protein/non-ribosomal peptide synthase protein (TIGR01720 family)
MPEVETNNNSIVDYLSFHANSSYSKKELFIFLGGEGRVEERITFEQMDRKVRSIAISLLNQVSTGDKVILCYPPGLDYILAFYACLYAGVVAVPVYPPQGKANTIRFSRVMQDCQATFILSNNLLKEQLLSRSSNTEELHHDQFILTDIINDEDSSYFQWPQIQSGSLAFLQYTSGSTGAPKGVMISHANIIANLRSLQEATICCGDDVFVNWLPLFHDLGLVNTMLLPVYLGAQSILMSPLAFVSNPRSWFEAITKYKGSICGGPNFSYELCLKKIKRDDFSGLELSSWRIAFNAAEPIYEKTIENFSEFFSTIGFNKSSFYPSYGMAEATVYLTGRKYDAMLAAKCHDDGKNVVACGTVTSSHNLRIVNPHTKNSLPENEVGEIWVSGPSIAMGYLGKPEQTTEIFNAKIHDDISSETWLRTGDLGFVKNGDLYVTGRIKELIIIRGQNYYPTDIERTVQESHSSLKAGAGAAFSVVIDEEERLVVVQEVERTSLRKLNAENVCELILSKITSEYQLDIHEILLIKPGYLEKTTSGKVQRQLCKQKYLSEDIEVIYRYKNSMEVDLFNRIMPCTNEEKIIANVFCDELGVSSIGINENIFSLGANSITLTRAILKINHLLNINLPITTIFDNPSIDQLNRFINIFIIGEGKSNDSGYAHIPKVAVGLPVPLSFAQQRLWFLWTLEGANPAYNESHVFKISGELNCDALMNAFHNTVGRHEVLRSRFVEEDGIVFQVFDPNAVYNIQPDIIVDEVSLLKILEEEALYPFELDKDSLIRIKLLKLESYYFLVVTMHHIVTDGWSLEIINREINESYKAALEGRPSLLAELPIQYADYSHWQRQHAQTEIIEKQLSYWKKKLQNIPLLHDLPLDKRRPIEQSFIGKKYNISLNKLKTEKINNFCEEKSVTLFIFLHSVLSLLLARCSGDTDIVIGSPIAGRVHKDVESLIGFFVNTLVFRHDLSECTDFNGLLLNCKKTAIDAYANQSVPFELIINDLNLQRDLGYSPLIQIILVLQNNIETDLKLDGLEVEKQCFSSSKVFAKYDLELSVIEKDNKLSLNWLYNSDLFHEKTIERLASSFEVIIDSVIKNPYIAIQDINILTSSDKQKLLQDWAKYEPASIQNHSLHEKFEHQAKSNPNSVAVIYENQKISYSELNERANKLAHYLIEEGVKANTLVALFIDRSIEMLIAILGILKAGSAYVPIDPDNPKSRTAYILTDSAVDLIVTRKSLQALLPQNNLKAIVLDDQLFQERLADLSCKNITPHLDNFSPKNLAYVIYTSGSTGNPKGVMVSHENVLRLFSSCENVYDFNSQDVWTLFHSYAFDFSVWEIWGALFHGGKLVVVPYWISRDSQQFIHLLNNHNVTVLNQTPSAFEQLMAADKQETERNLISLRYIIFGGEMLDFKTVLPWFQGYGTETAKLINMYGITETTVHVTHYLVNSNDKKLMDGSIIGRPLSDLQVYVLDDQLQLLPIGARGELYVAGAGLAVGYLNQATLTAERFIKNPFGDAINSHLYRTGDIVRFVSDGTLEYIGRKDHQVKIRGFRIELGEIEFALTQFSEVSACAVLAKDTGEGHKQLIAYIAINNLYDEATIAGLIREHLAALLPNYMLPSAYVFMAELPLTGNGKLDKKALLGKEITTHESSTYLPPGTEIERVLVEIWQQLLGHDRVSITDNFFALGGDSIIAIQLVSQARQKGLHFNTRDLFKHQSITELLPFITTKNIEIYIPQSEVCGEQFLLPIQKDFFSRQLSVKNHYNQSLLLTVPSGLKIKHLEEIVSALYQKHDALRLRFEAKEAVGHGRYASYDKSMLDDTIVYKDLGHLSEEVRLSTMWKICDELQGTLDIENGPLFRCVYFDNGNFQAQIFLVAHHLIIDGVSWRILLSDIVNAWDQCRTLKNVTLSRKTSSLQQWGIALYEYALSERLQKEKEYWYSLLSRFPKNITEKSTNPSFKYSTDTIVISLKINKAITSLLLGDANNAYKTKINEILLAAIFKAYSIAVGRPLLRIDVEGHGRELLFPELDISETVGWFTSIYPLVVQCNHLDDVGLLIKTVKELYRNIPGNGIGYGLLKDILQDGEINQLDNNAVPFMVFNYLGQVDIALKDGFSFHPANEINELSSDKKNKSAFPLEINCMILAEELAFKFILSKECNVNFNLSGFVENVESSILDFVDHCINSNAGFTPSDFPLIHVDQERLDGIISDHEIKNNAKVIDVYPLSSTQEEILFQGLYDASSNAYFEQVTFKFEKPFKVAAWRESWFYVFEKNEIFRTAFDHLSYSKPIQIVFDKVLFPWSEQDLRGLSSEQQESFISAEIIKHRTKGFSFSFSPLTQFNLYRLGHCEYNFVWNFHHILLDGWSMALVIGSVLRVYNELMEGKEPQLPLSVPYRNYIEWMSNYDDEKSKNFWRLYLAGYSDPLSLKIEKNNSTSESVEIKKIEKILSGNIFEKVSNTARQNNITLNTMCHAAFALVLQYYSDVKDVLFGETLSGRPYELMGVAEIVGLFIHTVPVRHTVDLNSTVSLWLKSIGQANLEREQHSLIPLAEISRASIVRDKPLFRYLLNVENYPVENVLIESSQILDRKNIQHSAHNSFPFTLVIIPDVEVKTYISYDLAQYDEYDIDCFLNSFHAVLDFIASNSDWKIYQIISCLNDHCANLMKASMEDIKRNRKTRVRKNFMKVD